MATGEKRKPTPGRKRTNLIMFLFIALIAAVVVVGVISLINGNKDKQNVVKATEEYNYESYSKNAYGWIDSSFIVASTSGVTVYSDGNIESRESFVMSEPVMNYSKKYALAYDVGGEELRLIDEKGNILSAEMEYSIVEAKVNDDGYFIVVSDADSYKAQVTIFDPSCNPIYKWYSGSGYIIGADMSPTSDEFAVLCLGQNGSYVNIFKLSSDQVQYTAEYADEILFDIEYLTNNRILLVGDSSSEIMTGEGEKLSNIDYGERVLTDYTYHGDNFVFFALSEAEAGNVGHIMVVGVNGDVISEEDTVSRIVSISAAASHISVLYSDRAVVYNKSLKESKVDNEVQGVKSIIATQNGKAVLISSYTINIF